MCIQLFIVYACNMLANPEYMYICVHLGLFFCFFVKNRFSGFVACLKNYQEAL